MALTKLIKILKEHPWGTYVVANLVLVLVEKLVEHDFVCPCRPRYTGAFFSLYLLMPLFLSINFGVYLWKSVDWANSKIRKRLCGNIWCVKILTCAFPSFFWLILFFGDGRFLACLYTPLKDGHIDSNTLPPWEWCDKNRTLTDDQYRSQISFYNSKITVFCIVFVFFLGALIFQCCDRCCVQCCGERCVGCYEEYLEIRTEQLRSSTYKVLCVAKLSTKYSGGSTKVSLCSVCDGTRVFLMTLQKNQIDMFEEGETYMVKNATVKQNHLFDEMILESKTGVCQTAPLQLEENDLLEAMERCLSTATALNDPELYLKKCFINLSGRDISVLEERAEGKEIIFVKVEAFTTENNQIILLTEDQEEKRVAQNLWPRDAGQLPEQLPMYVIVTQEGGEVKYVKPVKSQRTDNSMYKVLCVSKRATRYSSDSTELSLCSVCDGTRIFLITLQRNQIHTFEEGETYIVKNATVKKDSLFDEMILESGTRVYSTAPLQLEENVRLLAMERCFSKTTALNDPGLHLKKCYINLSGRLVSTRTPRQNQEGILEKQIEIEQNGVRVPVLLLKEAARTPFQENQIIKITYIKVTKNIECGRKLTSSDHTVITVLQERAEEEEQSFVKVEAFVKNNNEFIFLTNNQTQLNIPQNLWPRDADQLPEQLPMYLIVTRRVGAVIHVDVVESQM